MAERMVVPLSLFLKVRHIIAEHSLIHVGINAFNWVTKIAALTSFNGVTKRSEYRKSSLVHSSIPR